MKFVLISRHTNGAEVPESETEQNLKALGEWLAPVNVQQAMPIRGGISVTATGAEQYNGDIGGIIVFEAANLEQAVAIAKKSPGLKYGFTHEVLPEISMNEASQSKVKTA